MTTPGGSAPDGAWVLGSGFGQDVTEQSFNALMRGQGTQRGYETAHHDLMSKLGQLLLDVAAGLVQGAIDIGGTVIGVVTDIVDGIVNLVKNLAGAILGGGSRAAAAGLPDSFEPGELADIADGQNRLIGKIEALEDNAGFCTVTMSKNWNITGNANTWVPVAFDAQVTAEKNAVPFGGLMPPSDVGSGPDRYIFPGILLTAPGVWSVHSKVTLDAPGDYRYIEHEIQVHRIGLIVAPDPDEGVYAWIPGDPYTSTTTSAFSTWNDWVTIQDHLPVLVPDDIGEPWPGVPNAVIAGYHVTVWARFRGNVEWSMIGGKRRSALTVDRLSTDTTDYGAPDTATGTGNINAGEL